MIRVRRRSWHSLHRWLAIVGGCALVVWLTTGMVLSVPGLIAFPELQSVGADPVFESLRVSPAEAVNAAREAGLQGAVRDVVLRRVGPHTAFHVVSEMGTSRLVNADSGGLVTVDASLAERMAREQFGFTGQVIEQTVLDRPNGAYAYGPLPAIQLRFSDEPSDAIMVAQSSGEIMRVSPAGRLRILAGNLHSFEQLDRVLSPLAIDGVLILFAIVMLLASVIGFGIALPIRKRRNSVE